MATAVIACAEPGSRKGGPIEIRLTAQGLALEGELRNSSTSPVRVLHNPRLQASRLVLTATDGKELTPFDERSRQKFDRTVYSSYFSTVAPAGLLPLDKAEFRKVRDGVYLIRWGPYTYREVGAGRWKVRVVFESRIDQATDRDSAKPVSVPQVWKGTAESNTVEIELR